MQPVPSLAIELRGIGKRFGVVRALEGVDFSVATGRVHALLGENGAGKSTLMRVAYGLTQRDSGAITVFGQAITTHSVAVARSAGVGMVHQHLSLSPSLNAVENFALGDRGVYSRERVERRFLALSERFGLAVPPQARVRDLSIVQQQRLEILKALGRDARLLILDEPTAVLAPHEIDELLRWMRHFAAGGGAVIFVTHKLPEALRAADDVTVLRRGRVALTTRATDTSAAVLARAMFPDRSAGPAEARPASVPGIAVLHAQAVRIDGERGTTRISDATFEVRSGDVVGLAGVEGSGVRDLLHALAGLAPVAGGRLELPERIGFIPADRTHEGLILEFTLSDNVALRGAGQRRGVISWPAVATHTAALLQEFGVLPALPSVAARTLSGGNQQRVVVARELDGSTDLLVADNPTRGLDMQAADFVLRRLASSAARGSAVIVHSSDLDEVLSIATRVLVVFEGRVRETSLDADLVGRTMLGA